MESSQDYILVVGPLTKEMAAAKAIAQALNCSVVTIASPWQAVAEAQNHPPYLVILLGDEGQTWSPQIAREIRQSVEPERIVIVALTTSSVPSWQCQESSAEIDGFFVEPISLDVMNTLRDSAIAKKQLQSVSY